MENFTRSEKKYLLRKDQYVILLDRLKEHIEPDVYEKSKVSSLYYDNDKLELIRRSIEKPEYKEKFRVRCYGNVSNDDYVFVEIKKKLDGVVYKRRTKAKYQDIMNNIQTCEYKDKQIGNEIKYALDYYQGLSPAIYVSSTRTSYVGKGDHNLRITFDEDLKYRMNNLSLHESANDKELTDKVIMEIKVLNSYPLWLTSILARLNLFPRGFSKVGTAFMKEKENDQYSRNNYAK